VELRLAEPGDAPVRQLHAAREAHELVCLEHADLHDGVGAHERLPDRERTVELAVRGVDRGLCVLDVDDGHAFFGAHRGHAADPVGARDLGRAVASAGAVGDERLGAGRAQGAQHAAQGLGMSRDGALGRRPAQQVDLDRDLLARGDDRLPTAERRHETLDGAGQSGAVRGAHVAHRRGPGAALHRVAVRQVALRHVALRQVASRPASAPRPASATAAGFSATTAIW